MKLAAFFLILLSLPPMAWAQADSILSAIKLPPGFQIEYFAKEVPNARSLALGEDGTVYVGTRTEGKVYALRDVNGDGRADKKYILAKGLKMPNGVVVHQGNLYVAEVSRIIRFDQIGKHLQNPPKPKVIFDRFPNDLWHGWKYLRIGPDNKLYTAVGAPCNVCLSRERIYATIVRLNLDGSGFEIFAEGVRNSVGFDWHPQSKTLWFTDNGRDWLGDDRPPDELNHAPKKGMHFGYPYCHGGDIPDPRYGTEASCGDFIPPAWRFDAHVAPLGIRFYTGDQFPNVYQGQLFVAQHGSWNRSNPVGYRIVTLKFKKGVPVEETVFAQGWLQPRGRVLGRPVDILQMPDGSLLVSDDHRGAIYRIRFVKEK